MLVSELSACDAERMPSRSSVPVVTVGRGPTVMPVVGPMPGRSVGCAQSSWATFAVAPQAA